MTDAYKVISCNGLELPPELVNLVRARWMRSLRYGNDYFRLTNPVSFYRSYQQFIDGLLAKHNTWVRFAVLADDHDVVLGFAVLRSGPAGEILDYVHVHKDQRRQGIARRLMPNGVHTITHLTRTGLSIWGGKCPQWQFDPFA